MSAHRGQRKMLGTSFYHYPPYCLRHRLSLNLKLFQLGSLASEFLRFTYLNPPMLGLQACVVRPRLCVGGWGFEPMPSRFNIKHSDPISHIAPAFWDFYSYCYEQNPIRKEININIFLPRSICLTLWGGKEKTEMAGINLGLYLCTARNLQQNHIPGLIL